MMSAPKKECDLIALLKCSPYKVAIVTTGGGHSAIDLLMSHPGSSEFLISAYAPYGRDAINQLLPDKPVKYNSHDTAGSLAQHALTTAYENSAVGVGIEDCVGIGITCSLKTDPEREGRRHSAFITITTRDGSNSAEVELYDSATCTAYDVRQQQDRVIRDRLIDMLYTLPLFATYAVMPGSFRPWHQGHFNMIVAAAKHIGTTPCLEISTQVDGKDDVSDEEFERRCQWIPRGLQIIRTSHSLFIHKAIAIRKDIPLPRNIVFIVGADTWNRIWAELDRPGLSEHINIFHSHCVSFLVFPRTGVSIHYIDLVPNSMVTVYNGDDYGSGMDISSTWIRERFY